MWIQWPANQIHGVQDFGDTEYTLMPSGYKARTPWGNGGVGHQPLGAQQCHVRIHVIAGNGDLPLCSTSSPAAAWFEDRALSGQGRKKQ